MFSPSMFPKTAYFAGWLLLLMLILSIVQQISGISLLWISGSAAWVAALLLWPKLKTNQRVQALMLFGIGMVLMAIAYSRGTVASLEQAIGLNQPILAMLAAVSFLKLIRNEDENDDKIPVGIGAFFRTLFGINFLGSAINVTALIIVTDRLHQSAPFGRLQALVANRAFCLSVMFSPFIAGMALTLASVPGSSLGKLATFGLPFAIIGMLLSAALLSIRHGSEIRKFRGYPLHFDSLFFPVLLVVLVLFVNRVFPALSILTLIAILTPSLIIAILVFNQGYQQCFTRLGNHVTRGLADMSGELWLFLCAGVFATGLTSLVQSTGGWTPFDTFDAWSASLTLAGITLVSIIGVHPIICVSFLAPIIMPVDPPPNLLAMVFILGWAIGCSLSPFSGTNLILQGRFGIPSWHITRWNLLYGALLLLLGFALLYLLEHLS
ncbi:MAG: hypothetical protein ACI9FD_003635 [Gammaproteobacteria bacterium]|jgi:hypothetical protein